VESERRVCPKARTETMLQSMDSELKLQDAFPRQPCTIQAVVAGEQRGCARMANSGERPGCPRRAVHETCWALGG
jgi:hypothetical protein